LEYGVIEFIIYKSCNSNFRTFHYSKHLYVIRYIWEGIRFFSLLNRINVLPGTKMEKFESNTRSKNYVDVPRKECKCTPKITLEVIHNVFQSIVHNSYPSLRNTFPACFKNSFRSMHVILKNQDTDK
jgi:hypothetical protein